MAMIPGPHGGGISLRRLALLWYSGNNTVEIARKVGLTEHEVDRRMAGAKRVCPRDPPRLPSAVPVPFA